MPGHDLGAGMQDKIRVTIWQHPVRLRLQNSTQNLKNMVLSAGDQIQGLHSCLVTEPHTQPSFYFEIWSKLLKLALELLPQLPYSHGNYACTPVQLDWHFMHTPLCMLEAW